MIKTTAQKIYIALIFIFMYAPHRNAGRSFL